MVGDIGSKYGWECESEWLRRGAFPSGSHHGSSLFMDIQRQWNAISPVDLVKEFPFNSSPKYWIISNLPKMAKEVIFSKTAPGIIIMVEALLLLYDLVTTHWHSMMFPIFLQIPPSMIGGGRSGCGRTEAQQRLLCGVGKKNYNLQPFCFLLPLMRISLANNRFIFSNNSSACQRQWVSLKICTRREEKGKMPTCCIFFWLLAAEKAAFVTKYTIVGLHLS